MVGSPLNFNMVNICVNIYVNILSMGVYSSTFESLGTVGIAGSMDSTVCAAWADSDILHGSSQKLLLRL